MQIRSSLRTYILLSLVPLFLAASPAQAADTDLTAQCKTYHTSYDRTYCVVKLFLASDQELNDIYKKLKASTKGDTRQQLVQVQRDWITYRNGSCEGGSGSINVDCNYLINRERTTYLRDRLRECQTGSCNNALIKQESW